MAEEPDPQPPVDAQQQAWPSPRPEVIKRTLAWVVAMDRMEFPDDQADDVLARLVLTLAGAVAAAFDPQ